MREAQQDPHTAATIEAIGRAHEVLARRDLDEIMTTLTEDVIWETTSPPDGERHVGRDAVRRAMEEFLRGSPQARFETEEVVASGDRAFCTWVYHWTDREGKQGHIRGVDIVRVRDGKIAEMCAYVKG